MYSNQRGRKSVDSLSPTLPPGHRADFPFHGKGPHSPVRTHQRRDSTASSIHSIGGSLDTSGGWSSAGFESGRNAISTLLQPPIVRTGLLPHTSAPASSAHKPPTARDIPPVTLTNVPHVDSSEFKPYLSQVGALYEQLRRIQAEEDENPLRRSSKADESSDTVDEGHLRPGKRPAMSRRTSTASISSLSSIDVPAPPRRTNSGTRSRAAQGPPPLSTIPTVYFDQDFHLENPRIFDVVSERSEVVRPTGADDKGGTNGQAPRKALATNAILQEKLSWYMDTIEMHLIQSISTASTTFFTALGSLRELHSEAADSVERIKGLRKELEALDEEIVTGGLKIVHERRRRENIKQLHDAVMQLREIVDGLAVCESLVDSGQVDAALDNLDALEMLISGEEDPLGNTSDIQLRDLRGAVALQGVNSDLDTLRLRVGRAYEDKFLRALLGDLRSHVENVSTQEVLMRWSSASSRARGGHSREPSAFPSYMAATDGLRKELMSSISGLHRARYLSAAATAYRDLALREIKNAIRRPLPSSNDDDNESIMSTSTRSGGGRQRSRQEKSSILARNLCALDAQDAEQLLVNIYIGVAETLRRLSTQAKVLLDVASSIGEPPMTPSGMRSPPLRSPPFSPPPRHEPDAAQEAQEEIHKAMDIANLLGQAVDLAHDRIVKLLRARTEPTKQLGLVPFLRYFTLNLHFANECEAISGRSGTALKTLVNAHIKEFIQRHGDTEKQKLAQGMESDLWNAVDFNDKNTELLNQILEASTTNVPAWTESTRLWIPLEDKTEADELDPLAAQASGQANGRSRARAQTRTRSAVVESESFLLPNSAILGMNGMAQFLHLTAAIPSMTAEISASLVAYLQFFNSRCFQLILAAGATRSAGLKKITTRHLALASQALAFMAAIMPHVREFVRRHCGAGDKLSTVMGDFDKVKRTFQEHQNNVYEKLVEIMTNRALMGARQLKQVSWDSPSEGGTAAPISDYMETLVKETTTLHKNLTKTLSDGTVRMIMFPVFANYKQTFGAAYQGVELSSQAGKERMLRDVEFFEARLSKLDGFDDAGEHLLAIVKSKEVKAPEPEAVSSTSAVQAAEVDGAAAEEGAAKIPDEGQTGSPTGAEKNGDGVEGEEKA